MQYWEPYENCSMKIISADSLPGCSSNSHLKEKKKDVENIDASRLTSQLQALQIQKAPRLSFGYDSVIWLFQISPYVLQFWLT